MMINPKISIIVPVYNVEAYIKGCLESIMRQSYSDIEVLFVDDCGSDNSVSIIDSFISVNNLNNWKIIHHEHNKGLSGARNTGLREAKGDYVYFQDSDDEITDDCITQLVAPLEESYYDMIVGDYTTTQDGEKSMLNMESGAIKPNDKVLQTYAEGKWYVMAWNKLCNRRFLIENELYFEEGVLHEDVIWTFKVACKANSIYIENRPTYIYNIRQSSIMTSMSIEKDVSIYVKAFDCIVDFVKKENRECGKYEYQIIEGKKSGILYSLLEKGEYDVYNRFYPAFYKQSYISPIDAYKKGVISLAYLIRDFHYALPMSIGCWYKKMFYNVYYRMRGKKIEGAIWK